MDSTTGSTSNQQTSMLKRKYRILRAKILKILDEKFFHPSKDVTQYDARMAQIQTAFQRIREEDTFSDPLLQIKAPKIFDYSALVPTLKSTKSSTFGSTTKVYKDLESLSIENLCKYLSSEEIELVCEDPIYFLGRNDYRTNEDLNNPKLWNRQLELVKEKRIREANWKENMQIMKKTYLQTLTSTNDDKRMSLPLRSARHQNSEDPKETKERAIRVYSRKIKARNNQMGAMVKIKKIEVEEIRKEKESEWLYRADGKQERVLEKKKEALDRALTAKADHRMFIQSKFLQKEQKKEEQKEIQRITQDIEHFFRDQVTKKTKIKNLQTKSENAKTFSNFKFRKPFFLSRLEDQDRNFENSRDASPFL